MDLSICIANWNGRDVLTECLRSIAEDISLQRIRSETVVVDNGSTDGSIEMLQQEFPYVRLLVNSHNQGFARANNQAIKASTGKFVLLLNNDTEVKPGALIGMVRCLEADPTIGAIGPRVVNPDGSPQLGVLAGRIPGLVGWILDLTLINQRLFPGNPLDRHLRMLDIDITKSQDVEFVAGACLMTRRDILMSVGLIDESYPLGGEDMDLCLRIRKAGWRVRYLADAVVTHKGGWSIQRLHRVKRLRAYVLAGRRMLRKYAAVWKCWIFDGFLLCFLPSLFLASPFLCHEDPDGARELRGWTRELLLTILLPQRSSMGAKALEATTDKDIKEMLREE